MQSSLRDGFCETNNCIHVILAYLLFFLLFQQNKIDATSFERNSIFFIDGTKLLIVKTIVYTL